MLPFRKILFPVDYSEPCQAVVPYVKDMIRHFSAELTLVHAYGPEALAYSHLAITDPELPEEARTIQENRLRTFALEMFPGQHVEIVAAGGEPGTVIHQAVPNQRADLVMLATHGRGPVRRFLLGSVTAKVLHDVTAVVWTGTGSALTDHPPRIPYSSIVCALDNTIEAEGVLKASAAFAGAYDAHLSIVQVIATLPASPEVDFGPFTQDLVDAANSMLRELKGKLGVDAPHTVIDAGVADGVREEAIRRKADLVVVGRGHAQGAFSRVWSHLYPIVRESPCPVLSI